MILDTVFIGNKAPLSDKDDAFVVGLFTNAYNVIVGVEYLSKLEGCGRWIEGIENGIYHSWSTGNGAYLGAKKITTENENDLVISEKDVDLLPNFVLPENVYATISDDE